MAQDIGSFKVKKETPLKFKGFGLAYNYFSGHKKLSKTFSFKRSAAEQYRNAHAVFITYFDWQKEHTFHYNVDAGVMFWNKYPIENQTTINHRSEILQLKVSYALGRFGVFAKIGGIVNHYQFASESTVISPDEKEATFGVLFGLGAGYNLKIRSSYLPLSIEMVRINDHYSLMATVYLPLIFLK